MSEKIDTLLFDIVRCKELDNPESVCKEIIELQKNKEEWQVPEPWSGDIVKSPVLFIGKNPSINLREEYPLMNNDKWAEPLIEDFFMNRFGNGKKEWVKDGKRVLLKSKEKCKVEYSFVKNWSKTIEWFSQLTGKKINEVKPGLDYSITDIVHCKSERGKAAKNNIIKKCAKTHLIDILDLANAKLIIVLGNDAKLGIGNTLNGIKLLLFKISKYKFKQKEFYFLFMRHTNYFCKKNEKEPSPKNLLDCRKMSFEVFEKIWEILQLNPNEKYINWLKEGKSKNWY